MWRMGWRGESGGWETRGQLLVSPSLHEQLLVSDLGRSLKRKQTSWGEAGMICL